jgi:hypothetical protein
MIAGQNHLDMFFLIDLLGHLDLDLIVSLGIHP